MIVSTSSKVSTDVYFDKSINRWPWVTAALSWVCDKEWKLH